MSHTEHVVQSGPVALHAVTWGSPDHPPLMLIHGYPDHHGVWSAVARQLAESFYVVSYDVRGAGRSDTPAHTRDWHLDRLMADAVAVADQLLPGRHFHLAGHDWGSIQGWDFITRSPLQQRVLSYTSISGPCLDHAGFWMRDHLRAADGRDRRLGLRQLMRSWYIAYFQSPLLPELSWKLLAGRLWPLFLQRTEGIRVEASATQVMDGARGVQLYRANFIGKMLRPQPRYARCPVQLIVPLQDRYVGADLFSDLEQWVPELYRVEVRAGHWLMLSHADWLADTLRRFVLSVEQGTVSSEMAAHHVHQQGEHGDAHGQAVH